MRDWSRDQEESAMFVVRRPGWWKVLVESCCLEDEDRKRLHSKTLIHGLCTICLESLFSLVDFAELPGVVSVGGIVVSRVCFGRQVQRERSFGR